METVAQSSTEVIRELARRWFDEAWNQRTDHVFAALVDPACVGHHEGEITRGPGELRTMRDRLLQMIPDIKVQVEAVLVEGDEAVVRWSFEGTGPVGAETPRPVGFHGMTWMKFRDGKIVEGWDRWNQGAFVQQLTAV